MQWWTPKAASSRQVIMRHVCSDASGFHLYRSTDHGSRGTAALTEALEVHVACFGMIDLLKPARLVCRPYSWYLAFC